MKPEVLLVAAVTAWGTLGCGSDRTDNRAPIGQTARVPIGQDDSRQLRPEVAELLDGGNAHFRADEYELALDSYLKAAELSPDEPAVWMGVRMAALALGDSAVADSALHRVQELVPSSDLAHPPTDGTPPDSAQRPVERQTLAG